MMDMLLALMGAGSGGSLLAVAAAANARLKQTLHSPVAAAAFNFVVGFSTLALLIRLGVFGSQSLAALPTVPLWAFLGGGLGALFVSLNTLVIPQLGLTATTLAVVCSQMIMSLVMDHFGWLGVPVQPASLQRMMAIGCLLWAVALIQSDRRRPPVPAKLTSPGR